MTIQQQLKTLHQQITAAEVQYARTPASVKLLAVSKGQSAAAIKQVFQAGQHCFAENYLQEALPKINSLIDFPINWHFIGSIQSNKTRGIAEHFAWVQSVNQLKIAERLNTQRPAELPKLQVCIEVNISNEHSKTGISVVDLEKLAADITLLPRLQLRGLMGLPAYMNDMLKQQAQFAKLYHCYLYLRHAGYSIDTLSMGTSQDFCAAIAEGSTMVRIGTALFGEREKY